jgi:ATP-binding cassette subfamily C protein LapB
MSGFPVFIDRAARLVGQRLGADRRDEVTRLAAQEGESIAPLSLLAEAWRLGGLEGRPEALDAPQPADLPFAGWRADLGWFLVTARSADGRWTLSGPQGEALAPADSLQGITCLSLPRRAEPADDQTAPRALGLVWRSLLRHRTVFIDAVLATVLVNLLTLAASLYSMQVYDRVIPNQGFQTLKVLTVGAVAAILLELLLKHLRARLVERACTAMDEELSIWFFARMLGIRMEKRPSAVGTLAGQVKGFETVRGVLTSGTLFVLADVPFAIFFVAVIAMIGGWLVLVPLVSLPLALVTGIAFHRAIARHARDNQADSHLKTGLLVEAIDGAETVKSHGAEWKLQSRWARLARRSADSEQRLRNLSAAAQNLTAGLQQLGYVALVAAGAWLATENMLTMGGLLACSIISNRAMAPIIQLPGMMVQWAHARAALEGLDRIIALPGEADDQRHALTPGVLEGALRLERVRFSYGMAGHLALDIERLELRPGERVGLVGAIGSGKSTLLKLASGLYRPAEGKCFLGGLDMALLSPAVLREAIGYLPQDVRLFSGTLRENLLVGLPDPGDEAVLAAARRTGLIELITAQPKGLALPITEGGRGVSGGQRQLVGLTRLLIASPRVWLLDEPTGSMDAATEARVTALLDEVARAGATLLVATHKTGLLPMLGRLVVLHGGRVVLDGPRGAVLERLQGRPAAAATQGSAS